MNFRAAHTIALVLLDQSTRAANTDGGGIGRNTEIPAIRFTDSPRSEAYGAFE